MYPSLAELRTFDGIFRMWGDIILIMLITQLDITKQNKLRGGLIFLHLSSQVVYYHKYESRVSLTPIFSLFVRGVGMTAPPKSDFSKDFWQTQMTQEM